MPQDKPTRPDPIRPRHDEPPGDPFPRDEIADVLRRIPSYARLAWSVGRDPELPVIRRGAVVAAAAYLASPLDAIPGIVPFVGQLDDVLVVIVALRFALAGLSSERRHRHLAAAGLSDEVLAADLHALLDVTAWIMRGGARVGMRLSQRGLVITADAGRRLLDLGEQGAGRLREALAGRRQTGARRN